MLILMALFNSCRDCYCTLYGIPLHLLVIASYVIYVATNTLLQTLYKHFQQKSTLLFKVRVYEAMQVLPY